MHNIVFIILARVLFEYQASASDELTFKVGDIITNVKNVEDGWCEGTLNGKTGMFPDNFVKVLKKPIYVF